MTLIPYIIWIRVLGECIRYFCLVVTCGDNCEEMKQKTNELQSSGDGGNVIFWRRNVRMVENNMVTGEEGHWWYWWWAMLRKYSSSELLITLFLEHIQLNCILWIITDYLWSDDTYNLQPRLCNYCPLSPWSWGTYFFYSNY